MKNSMQDLNDHLFAQIERLGEEGSSPEKVALEIERSKAIALVAARLAHNAQIELQAKKLLADHEIHDLPPILESKRIALHIKEG